LQTSLENRIFVDMKKLVAVILLLLIALAAAGQQLPSVTLQDGAGKAVQTASLVDGKTPFVLSIWMTTCKPCLKELDTLSEEYPDWNASFPLRIYAVSMDDSRSLKRAVAMAQGRDWEGITALFDVNADLKRALNVNSVPQVFVYDKDGKLFWTHIGYRPGDEAELLNQVRKCAGK
jgi:peroxiredoxin